MKVYIKIKPIIFVLMLGLLIGCKKESAQDHIANNPITVTDFFPKMGKVGTRILISGENFTSDTSRIKVSINGKYLPLIGANTTQIMAVVHDKIGKGVVTVLIDGREVSSLEEFDYQFTRRVETLAGDGNSGFVNAQGNQARFSFKTEGSPWFRGTGIVVDSKGNVFVVDPGNLCIRKIDRDGVVSTFAGNPNEGGANDGQGTAAKFTLPYGLAIDAHDNLYVVDPGTWSIRKITPDAIVTTFASTAREPWNVAVDKKTGKIFYGSNSSGDILRVEEDRSSTVIISGLNGPMGMDFDSDGNLYVAEAGNHVIRRFEAGTWTSSIIAGQLGQSGISNGAIGSSSFANPGGLCVGIDGRVYVAGNSTWDGGAYNPDQSIRFVAKMTAGWITDILAGGGSAGFTNEVGTSASFNGPLGVAVDKEGTVYVLDKSNNAVRKIISE